MVSGIQLLGVIFGLALSYFTFLCYKRGEFTKRETIGWELLWVIFVLVTMFPEKIAVYSRNLGAIRPLDLFVILGFIIVLSISFYTYVNVDRLRKSFEKTIRELALNHDKVKNKKDVDED